MSRHHGLLAQQQEKRIEDILKRIFKKVHPDFFFNNLNVKQQNAKSLSKLTLLLNGGKK